MLQQIADLVEFDLNRFSAEAVLEDFRHKFTGSILKIDGKYYKVNKLEYKNDIFTLFTWDNHVKDIKWTAPKSIEKVLPKTGLYSSEFGLLYLYRLPKRQWLKSLSLGQNYRIEKLRNSPQGDEPTLFNTVLTDNPTYAKESIIYRNKVYLHWKEVGTVEDATIYVTNSKFLEEIKELWNPQFQIILDVKRPQQKAEKLMLDF